MTISEDERTAARIEELDRLIAELQERKRALLGHKESTASAAPVAPKREATESRPPAKVERPLPSLARSPEPKKPKSALEGTLDMLPWKSFKKKEGEWAFLRDREGMLIDELQSEKEFVDRVRKEGEVVVGKYRYQVSEDKFLNRYYQAPKAA